MASESLDDDNGGASAIEAPLLASFLRGLWRSVPRPVVVSRGQALYRVLVEGSGFNLHPEAGAKGSSGFFTTRFVSAASRPEAEVLAIQAVLAEWRGDPCYFQATGVEAPIVGISETEALDGRFRMRRGAGFTFWHDRGQEQKT